MPGWLESLLFLLLVPLASGFLIGRFVVVAVWPVVWLVVYLGYDHGWWETSNESVDVAVFYSALISAFFCVVGVFARAKPRRARRA